VKRIMAAQMARADRVEKADYVIDNSGSLDALDEQVEELHKEFLQRAQTAVRPH
jgi:dephospho-CoA kinase